MSGNNRKRRLNSVQSWCNEDGMTLLITMLTLFIVALTGITLARIAGTEVELTGHYCGSNQAFFAADGGAEYGLNELLQLGRSKSRHLTAAELAAITVPPLPGSTFTTFTVAASGPLTQAPLTSGYSIRA